MNYPFFVEMIALVVICAIPATIAALAVCDPIESPKQIVRAAVFFTLALVFIVLIATNLSKVIAY